MRIIAGKKSGRRLKAPKGWSVRPTPDRVRHAIFNSLAARLAGARILELFAGTGALGIEALSRGAKSAISVEKASKHARLLRQNFANAGFQPQVYQVWQTDAFKALSLLLDRQEQFDLVLADPPFGAKNLRERSTSYSQQLLDSTVLPRLLLPGGLLVLGHARRDQLTIPFFWEVSKVLRHGDSTFRLLCVAGPVLEVEAPEANSDGN